MAEGADKQKKKKKKKKKSPFFQAGCCSLADKKKKGGGGLASKVPPSQHIILGFIKISRRVLLMKRELNVKTMLEVFSACTL